MCHPVGGGAKPPPANHASYTNATCLGCHPAADAAPAQPKPESSPAGQPPPPSQGGAD